MQPATDENLSRVLRPEDWFGRSSEYALNANGADLADRIAVVELTLARAISSIESSSHGERERWLLRLGDLSLSLHSSLSREFSPPESWLSVCSEDTATAYSELLSKATALIETDIQRVVNVLKNMNGGNNYADS